MGRQLAGRLGEYRLREPMRVLIWHWGRRGGGPRYTLELTKALRERSEFELHLSLSRQSELFQEFDRLNLPGYHITTYTGKLSAALALLRLPSIRQGFYRYLRAQSMDVVVCTMGHIWSPFVAPRILACGARSLFILHDALPHPGERYGVRGWMLRREVALAHGVLTLSEHVRRQLGDQLGFPLEKSWTIPHGVFFDGQRHQRKRYPSDRNFKLLFFGRLLPYKGLDLALEAFRWIKKEGPQAELLVAGSGNLGRLERAFLKSHGVQIDNRWIPEEEIPELFSRADLVILPYKEASQSGVAAIAYGRGLPVIATPVGGLKEQVVHGKTGLIAEDMTPKAFAAAVLRMVQEPALYEHCVEGTERYAREYLSWPSIARRVAAIIRHVALSQRTVEDLHKCQGP